ncbi:CoxG family protein [Beijerinckia sp. L45]|uniref:CoxG family protein n=1 Tax=Beijerinckia sp. L45 TaxID=1641855 RepID=UPI00131E1AC6|nr:carbon monoxide dehydrogenase subunit G [Beijerinckia sp. L45]
MELDGEQKIPLPRDRVWTALNDPAALRACIPGCKELTKTSDTGFSARVVSKIGPVSASFAGTVDLTDIDPGRAYTISGSGQGGVAGFAKGSARVELADDGEAATILTYTAKAEIGGKLASVGSRMLKGAARKTADEFFTNFVTLLADAGANDTAVASPPPEVAALGQPPSNVALSFPSTIKIEFGELRVVTQTPWMTFAAIIGWLAAAGLAWRAYH